MLDIKLIRENKEKIINDLAKRNISAHLISDIIGFDEKKRELIKELDQIRAKKNLFNKEITKLNKEDKTKKIQQLTLHAQKESKLEDELVNVNDGFIKILKNLPNIPSADVKVGKNENENEIIKNVGDIPKFSFKPKSHLELGIKLEIIDTEKAVKVSGTRFNYLKNEAVSLQFALIQFALSVLTNEKKLKTIIKDNNLDISSKTFIPIIPPVLVKEETLDKMARLEPREERYFIPSDNLFLVGSAEHSLGALHIDEIINEDEFPIRYVGYSTSFRREAGSYGKDTKGILRVHQFDKLEIESFTLPENSLVEQDFIITIQEYLMKSLKIPYRIVKMCTGDMTAPDARQVDIEAWIPSQNTYRETHTSDLTTDYQARRLNTRFKRKNGIKGIVHMNDATVFAIGRTLIAILENNQNKDGSINIPEILQPFIGKLKVIENK